MPARESSFAHADEVWTGDEQQVAAHCFREGLLEEGWAVLAGLWDRYDGTRRNPYNHIECGDHYVRSLSGWTVLNAFTGRSWNALSGELVVRQPHEGERLPVLLGAGWGYVHSRPRRALATPHGVPVDTRGANLVA